jgi:hypothetical protein
LLPSPRNFYEQQIGKLSRSSRGWSQGNCPFHISKSKKSFSVNLDSGGFFCHGCGAHGGDIVTFVMLRDGVGFLAACKSLGAWQDGVADLKARREREAKCAAERQRQADYCVRVEGLLEDMETLERIRDGAFNQRHSGLEDIASAAIRDKGGEFVKAKVTARHERWAYREGERE